MSRLRTLEPGPSAEESVDAQELWNRYRRNGRPRPTALRLVAMAAVYFALGVLLFRVLGRPHVLARGALARTADFAVLILSVASITVLLFYVIDATRECTRFIAELSERPSRWPVPGERELIDRQLHDDDRGRLSDVLFVARRTKVVGDMILLPFFALLLMILSRTSYFDGWDWPLALILIFGIQAVLALRSAFHLRRTAEAARRRAIERLTATLVRRHGSKEPEAAGRARQIQHVVQELRDLRDGAFAPWSQRPVLRALLMPSTGIGIVTLLDALATGAS